MNSKADRQLRLIYHFELRKWDRGSRASKGRRTNHRKRRRANVWSTNVCLVSQISLSYIKTHLW